MQPEREPSRRQRIGLETLLGAGDVSLRRRLAMGMMVGVLLIACLAAVFSWRQYQDGKRKALADVRARVILATTVFDTYFAGQLSALQDVALAPAVRALDLDEMRTYFDRIATNDPQAFTAGIGWIDKGGFQRVSSEPTRSATSVNVADRSYFRAVMETGKPFVSEGLETRLSQERVVVMAVPTRDESGNVTGVLAGGLLLQQITTNQQAIDLGFDGLVLLDREGHELTSEDFTPPSNAALAQTIKSSGAGVLSDSRGLGGAPDRVVAFSTSALSGWTTVIDRARSSVFAAQQRSFVLELGAIGTAALIVFAVIGWGFVRLRRAAERDRESARDWELLMQSLVSASTTPEVTSALAASLADTAPGASVIVALRGEGRPDFTISSLATNGIPLGSFEEQTLVELVRPAVRSREPLELAQRVELEHSFPGLDPDLRDRIGSLFAVPLAANGGRVVGAVVLLFPDERSLDEHERSAVLAQAAHAGQSVFRASGYEREHDVALNLQRSLLPERLPVAEGLELAGRYLPGGDGLEIGGDWYDALRRPDGIFQLTVGDVAGRGIPAAVLMGKLVTAFRAYAYDHSDPHELPWRLARHLPDDAMATAAFVALDPYTHELVYASAGHPPMLLLDQETREVVRLDDNGGPPLGWTAATSFPQTRVSLPARATLLAYTDGLVERRGASLDEGIDRVASILRTVGGADANAAADALLEALAGRLEADDVALILLNLTEVPARMDVELPAHPAVLAGLRRRLHSWLELREFGEDQRHDVVLAVSEACNNAIEHAYRRREGTVKLVLEHRNEALEILVEDEGDWRAPDPGSLRGRGILIMEQTMDRAEIEHDTGGTRVALELRLDR